MKPRSLILTLLGSLFALQISSSRAQSESLENGAYMTRISGCADCHTADPQKPMAGGLKLPSPFGIFYTPNITPDNETGIGKWSEADFVRAIRFGKRPDGSLLFPAFPYRAYSKLTDSDLHDMFIYLRTLAPIQARNIPHKLDFPYDQRWLVFFWQELFFGTYSSSPEQRIKLASGAFEPDKSKTLSWNRGAYLVEAAAHCAECHTPRNEIGGLKSDLWMSGNSDLVGEVIPNITPDPSTGLEWTKQDWLQFLSSGYSPSHKTPGAEMADVIQNTSFLTESDRQAMVEYLTSLKPVHRVP